MKCGKLFPVRQMNFLKKTKKIEKNDEKTEKIWKKEKKGHNKKALYEAKILNTDILRI